MPVTPNFGSDAPDNETTLFCWAMNAPGAPKSKSLGNRIGLGALADDLDGAVGAERRLGLVVEFLDFDLAAENAALGVDLLDREQRPVDRTWHRSAGTSRYRT